MPTNALIHATMPAGVWFQQLFWPLMPLYGHSRSSSGGSVRPSLTKLAWARKYCACCTGLLASGRAKA